MSGRKQKGTDPQRLARTLWRRVAGALVKNPPKDLGRTVLLAGSGRSGTTWVTELLNIDRDFRVVFEPFDSRFNPSWVQTRQYLEPGDEAPAFEATVRQALDGTLSNPWVDAHNTALRPGLRLVKAIRANLFLGWLAERFPEVRIVYLLRHPLAVALSREQMNWGAGINQLTGQSRLVERLGAKSAWLREERDPFLRQVLLWCVENAVALEAMPSRAHVVYYEDLCVAPEAAAGAMFAALGLPVPGGLAHAAERPSALSRGHSAVLLGQRPVDAWVSKVDAGRRADALRYVEAFGLGHLYGDSPLPIR